MDTEKEVRPLKIRVEMSDDAQEEVIIKCKEITPEIIRLEQLLAESQTVKNQLTLYKDDTEYYIDTSEVLFFETEGNSVVAHTKSDVYEVRMKLYELEELFSNSFQRISKSAIVNVKKIYSIRRNVTSSSAIEFEGTYKQIYVSRMYYKLLRERLDERGR